MSDLETHIISSVCNFEDAAHALMPHIKPEYFADDAHRIVFQLSYSFITSFNKCPPKEALIVELDKLSINEAVHQKALELIPRLYTDEAREVYKSSKEWLYREAETYCRDRAIYLGIMKSLLIIEGQSVDGKKVGQGAIPKLLQDALNISFNPPIGHDFIADSQDRYEFYHLKEKRIKTGIDMLDQVTKGGFPIKTLNIYLAGTGVGKTLTLCSIAANMFMQGENVLYITCEMAQERIAERIDANLMDLKVDSLMHLPYTSYNKKIQMLRDSTQGKLIIKEYPPTICSANHIRALLDDLKLKKGFVPTVLVVDYLALMASTMIKSKDSMYSYVKSVAEELRSVGVEYGVPIHTAAQTNRDGQNNADVDLEQVSESHGLSMTADSMFAIISTPQLEQMQQIKFKQLKNRFGPLDSPSSFLVGIDRAKMRLFNISQAAQHTANQQHNAQASMQEHDSGPINRFGMGGHFNAVKKAGSDWTV